MKHKIKRYLVGIDGVPLEYMDLDKIQFVDKIEYEKKGKQIVMKVTPSDEEKYTDKFWECNHAMITLQDVYKSVERLKAIVIGYLWMMIIPILLYMMLSLDNIAYWGLNTVVDTSTSPVWYVILVGLVGIIFQVYLIIISVLFSITLDRYFKAKKRKKFLMSYCEDNYGFIYNENAGQFKFLIPIDHFFKNSQNNISNKTAQAGE